jgi:hypothetical protein
MKAAEMGKVLRTSVLGAEFREESRGESLFESRV